VVGFLFLFAYAALSVVLAGIVAWAGYHLYLWLSAALR
jgi:hypothetical protein